MLFCKCVWPWRNISCFPWEVQRKCLESITLLITKITITHLLQRSTFLTYVTTVIHCKCINCQKHNFHSVMISNVLPLPFWHLITVPSAADKRLCSCIFWNSFLFHTDYSFYSQPVYKYSKNKLFRSVMICLVYICIVIHKIILRWIDRKKIWILGYSISAT